jgi:hypothetical protein
MVGMAELVVMVAPELELFWVALAPWVAPVATVDFVLSGAW